LSAAGVRAAFLTPAHQFPTGVVLAPHRRRELLARHRARRDALLDALTSELPAVAVKGVAAGCTCW
jgi:DNA-binding transcriptional MocR family regulator